MTVLRVGQPRDRGLITGRGKISSPRAFRPAVKPTGTVYMGVKQPRYTGTLYTGMKQPGLKINPSRPPSTEIKNVWSNTSTQP